MNLKIEAGKVTLQAMIDGAAELFAKHGYAKTSTEDIVAKVGVTRGALYHHFKHKKGLFTAVFEQTQANISKAILNAALAQKDPWSGLKAGCRAFLETCLKPSVCQIVLLDAPSVLGLDLWRKKDLEYGGQDLIEGINALKNQGEMKDLPVEAVAHILSGAMNEAAMWINQSKSPQLVLEQTTQTLDFFIDCLKK